MVDFKIFFSVHIACAPALNSSIIPAKSATTQGVVAHKSRDSHIFLLVMGFTVKVSLLIA